MNASRGTILKRAGLTAALVVVAFALGVWVRGCGRTQQPSSHDHAGGPSTAGQEQMWTCPMHPQIRQPNPGHCPICGMPLELVKADEGAKDLGAREVKLSPGAVKLAEIRVTPVERRFVEAEVRMVGKVAYDETRLGTITARVPGRLDRLYVDYTGIPVSKGEHLVLLYSPELLTAQQELLQAVKAVRQLEASGATAAFESARLTLHAVREKLRLWDLTDEQIEAIEQRGTANDHVTIYAPMGGIVIHKNAVEGMYVQVGTPIYTIADLSRVWVKLDAYESDLQWVKYGQTVTVQTDAYPGEPFDGTIAFVDPVLDERTRTVKVRVNVENPHGTLKPGMFVRAVVRATLAAGGRVVNAELAGKWISPMHPEIVKDEPGTCDVCGMPLVRAETLGYVTGEAAQAPLVIPASAPLITGKRAIVYVKSPTKEGVFEGREIMLGPRAGQFYLVHSGLDEDERVVSHGAFKIDSAVQLSAKPSMMQPEGGAPPAHQHGGDAAGPADETSTAFHIPDAFQAQLDAVYSAYFGIQHGLSRDNLADAQEGSNDLLNALNDVDMGLLTGAAHMTWMKDFRAITRTAKTIGAATEIADARASFALLSESVFGAARRFGSSGAQVILRFHCPMAFDNRGADWLQTVPDVENPYFGSQMFQCGEQVEVISAGPAVDAGDVEHE